MKESAIFPWITNDVAIEIISKMVGEQAAKLENILAVLEADGLLMNDSSIQQNADYQACMVEMARLRREIDQLYKAENTEVIYKKVAHVYAPFLKAKFEQLPTAIKA